jgi:hypothetical protein
MWRVFLCLLAAAYVDTQEIDEPEEGAVLESVLDDEEGRGKFRARSRVRACVGGIACSGTSAANGREKMSRP